MGRIWGSLIFITVAGCSTAPLADLLDYTSPGRSTPDPYQRGPNGPTPPAIPPVPFDRPPNRDTTPEPPIPNTRKEREPPRPIERDDDPPPIAPPPSGD